jgi:hypothetical protein
MSSVDRLKIESPHHLSLPNWGKVLAALAGVLLMGDAMRGFLFGSGSNLSAKFIVGAACLYATGISRRLYISEEGIVRETRTWLGARTEVFPWEEVKFVTLATRGNTTLAFFERDQSGWKVPLKASDEPKVQELIARRAPGVQVDRVRG